MTCDRRAVVSGGGVAVIPDPAPPVVPLMLIQTKLHTLKLGKHWTYWTRSWRVLAGVSPGHPQRIRGCDQQGFVGKGYQICSVVSEIMEIDVLKSSLGHLGEAAVVPAAGSARELSYLYVLTVLQRRLWAPVLFSPDASGTRTRCGVRGCFQGREQVCLRDYSICVKDLSRHPILGSEFDCDLRS